MIEQGIEAGQAASADWHSIVVEGTRFKGAGDPSKLGLILKTFLDWAEGVLTNNGVKSNDCTLNRKCGASGTMRGGQEVGRQPECMLTLLDEGRRWT